MKEMAYLPCDLVILILSRLSVKTLSKFRCVCKLWLHLISDPHLLHLHSLRSKRNPLFFFSSIQYSNRVNTLHIKIYVCNPSTQEYITLPKPTPSDADFIGFGYNSSTKEYKVVRMFIHWTLQLSDQRYQVLTLGSSSWRAVKGPQFNVHTMHTAFVNGALHWMALGEGVYVVLAFDIETEEFNVIRFPENFDHSRETNVLGEFGGLLCLTVAAPGGMDIWMLKDYENHVWAKEYSINLNTINPYDDMTAWYFNSRDIRDGKILIKSYRGELGYYDPQSKSFKRFEIDEMIGMTQFSFYVESLLSLGSRIKPQGISIGS
ncbi:hypothetical protein HHK36_006978 [Tetracentron sinense]|uniref:F-box domain-containing protein n=1 Tax=Tetracentron sinense TaxID=13715 RepID=A0A834ZQQ5_TETSI|nr:hypothetical protein HHK36_006978 [Tetracentron sinense]